MSVGFRYLKNGTHYFDSNKGHRYQMAFKYDAFDNSKKETLNFDLREDVPSGSFDILCNFTGD